MRLLPCGRCRRHVRIGDACPFCAATPALATLALAGALATGCGGGMHEQPTTAREQTVSPSEPAQVTENRTEPEPTTADDPAAREDDPARGPDGGGAVAAYGGPSPSGPSLPPR